MVGRAAYDGLGGVDADCDVAEGRDDVGGRGGHGRVVGC